MAEKIEVEVSVMNWKSALLLLVCFCYISLCIHHFGMGLEPFESRQNLKRNRLWNGLIKLCYDRENWVTSFSCRIKNLR